MLTVCPSCRHTFQPDVHAGSSPSGGYCSETMIQKSSSPLCPTTIPVVVSATIHLPTTVCPSGASCTVNLNASAQFNDNHIQMNIGNGGGCSPLTNISVVPISKQDRVRHILSGGNVIRMSDKENDNPEKIKNDNVNCNSGGNMMVRQVSPTSSLSFIIPTTPVAIDTNSNPIDNILRKTISSSFISSELDLQRLSASLTYLNLSGWYHRGLSWKDSVDLLMPTAVGTFLVRDSSDPRFLYSISIQTKCGPTSIRIHYSNGEFRLDAERDIAKLMPKFSCVIKLIQYYMETTQKLPLDCFHNETQNQVWIDCIGQIYSQIVLKKPLPAKHRFPMLKHLCRLTINKHFPKVNQICSLPPSLITYVQEYPYKY